MKKINLKISFRIRPFSLFIILTALFISVSFFLFYRYYEKPEKTKEIPLSQTKFTFSEKNYKNLMTILKEREESFGNIDKENIRDIFSE